MFVEYKSTRAKKAPEELEASKTWQVNARRLIVPIDAKKYGLKVKQWQEEGKKRHAITWAKKPYCKLLLNNDKKAKAIAMLEVNTGAGLAVQVNPAKLDECYISIPKGALEAFPKASCMLDLKQEGAKITVCKK